MWPEDSFYWLHISQVPDLYTFIITTGYYPVSVLLVIDRAYRVVMAIDRKLLDEIITCQIIDIYC